MPHPCRALIAAPPGLMRRSLWAVLSTFPYIQLIGEAGGCLSAQSMSQELKPDIMLISAELPADDVSILLRNFAREDHHKPYTIVFVSTSEQKRRALEAGADAALWQSGSTRRLEEILKQFQAAEAPSR